MKKILLSACMMACALFGYSQNGVEGIIVEDYYTYDAASVADAFSPAPELGSKTYRIYVDLAPGFRLNAAFGSAIHNSHISTTTTFYNHAAGGSGLASGVNAFFHGTSNAALDSWLSIGAAGPGAVSGPFLMGLTKAEDTDGSIFSGQTILQGTTNPINMVDGMTSSNEAAAAGLQQFPNVFANATSTDSELLITNGSWFVTGGVAGPTATNRVLIAQVTTTGELSFELSLQVGGPNGPERYVPSNPVASLGETVLPGLTFPTPTVGCTDSLACNYLPSAATDDGSCLLPDSCHVCNLSTLERELIDTNNNMVCDSEEILGCTDSIACNYNVSANVDNNSCLVPDSCNVCDFGALQLIDTNSNMICDADEILGCTDSIACNYNVSANIDDQSCLLPDNCNVCDFDLDTLELIDVNNNGICDAIEVSGCTDILACNYNDLATFDDSSCILPDSCNVCDFDLDTLELIDVNNNGICDATEVLGCINSLACNYNELANVDDGSCLVQDEICFFCSGDSLVLSDNNNNGICDATEVGCTDTLACNYDPSARFADNSCLFSNECSECSGDTLALRDTNDNGLCDSTEIAGCTDSLACNYDVSATFEDNSCLLPDSCNVCSGGTLILINACDSTVGVNEFNSQNLVKVFPNPTNEFLNISVSEDANIQLLDVVGKNVITENNAYKGVNKKLNLQNVSEGVYFLKVYNKNSYSVTRIVISR